VACREYLCNPQLRQQIDGQVEAARQAGFDVRDPKTLVGTGAGAIGTLVVENVDSLGLVGAPVIALLTIIISNIGLNAFCEWARSNELRDSAARADSPDASYADPPRPPQV